MAQTLADLDFFEDDDDLSIYNGSFDDLAIVEDDQEEDDWGISSESDENDTEQFSTEEEEPTTQEPTTQEPEDDVISKLLKTRGINDSSKIKFENESGEIEERNWKDLSVEELFNIINGDGEDDYNPEVDLDDSEIDLINRIRLSSMSVNDYIQYEVLKGISAYARSLAPQEPSYVVDDLSDDELFILDLQTKVADLTDEELEQALENAKTNETLYAKLMLGLRNEYKELETRKLESEQAIQEQTRQEQFAQFSNSIVNSINNFNSIGELDVNMEDQDANELYQFITGTDPAGINYFAKALNDPDTLTRVAWFALHGEDVINSISDYYKGVISLVSKSQYEKGRQSVKLKKTPDVVVNPVNNTSRSRKTASIYDLD